MPAPILDLAGAANVLRSGGVVIYQTETFFALGCLASLARPVEAIFAIKNRDWQKPLPLVAANMEQASQAVDLAACPPELLACFWPGPLSVILPAKNSLAHGVINSQHKAALRIPALASSLAEAAGGCITATSANISGRAPASSIAELEGDLLSACAKSGLEWGILAPESRQAPLAPSTLLEPLWQDGRWRLRMWREGAINKNQLQDWAFI